MKRQPSTPPAVLGQDIKLPGWILWTAATFVGYALGMTVSSVLVGYLMKPLGRLLAGMVNVLIYGAVIGIFLGLCQFVVMPHGLVPFAKWILAALAGAAMGLSVASIAAETLGNVMDATQHIVLGQAVIAITAGAILGLAVGLGEWLALRPRLPRLWGWLFASIFGMILGSLIAGALLGLIALPLLSAAPNASVGGTLGLLSGFSQGLVFWANRVKASNKF